ncbi:hypothetical protein LCGC14_2523850 [marine sediment metagenome]|uniref:Uncharacterized protein n=1 Tax=marine sediment metagenome TaxID=412755 RepID=A0A0F9BIF2_9ZZZZ
MFFSYPEKVKVKVYVIVGMFGTSVWYLKDADTGDKYITVRTWTIDPKKAVHFDHKEDAENVGLLILNEGEFYISSFTKSSVT